MHSSGVRQLGCAYVGRCFVLFLVPGTFSRVHVYNCATCHVLEECVGVLPKGVPEECATAVHVHLLLVAGALLTGARLRLCAAGCPRFRRVLAVALC
jgi:hypothetical protein